MSILSPDIMPPSLTVVLTQVYIPAPAGQHHPKGAGAGLPYRSSSHAGSAEQAKWGLRQVRPPEITLGASLPLPPLLGQIIG